MGGLSNFLSWVSEEREREITIGKSKGTQKGETYSQSGSSEAPQFLVWCGFFFFFWRSLCVRESAAPSPQSQRCAGSRALNPRADGWRGESGGKSCGGGGQSLGRAAALPLYSLAEAGCVALKHASAATLAATSRWSVKASPPPFCPARCSKVQFHLSLLRWFDWLAGVAPQVAMDLDGRNGRAGGKNFLKRDKKR